MKPKLSITGSAIGFRGKPPQLNGYRSLSAVEVVVDPLSGNPKIIPAWEIDNQKFIGFSVSMRDRDCPSVDGIDLYSLRREDLVNTLCTMSGYHSSIADIMQLDLVDFDGST